MLQKKKKYEIVLVMAAAIGVNYGGKLLAQCLNLPLWLDSLGTVFAAYLLGPVFGAVTGAAVNLIYGLYAASLVNAVYGLVSITVGVIVGITAKKGYLETLFHAMTASCYVTAVTTALSVPLNYLFFEGATGNLWGDGMIALLEQLGCNSLFSHVVGEFYLDFLDKTLALVLLYLSVKGYRRLRTRISQRKASAGQFGGLLILTAVFLLSALLQGETSFAAEREDGQEIDYNTYVQTVYNRLNGLPGGCANDIAQTEDGVLWIGTYGGVYRYTGNEFRLMNEFESVKNVNCFYQEKGRLWIGTNDSGLSLCVDEKITNVITRKQGLPSDSVQCMAQSADGSYYVGTSGELAILTLSGEQLTVTGMISEISYADDLCADGSGNVAVVTNAGVLYLVRQGQVIDRREAAEGMGYTCCTFGASGRLYVGTSGSRLEIFRVGEKGLEETEIWNCTELENLKSLRFPTADTLFVCADNGIACFDSNGKYQLIRTAAFHNSIDHMLMDYQGNLWFTSSRLGLLRLCPSVFTDVYHKAAMEDKVVNSVIRWEGNFYFGTDSGLDMTDGSNSEQKENWLTKMMEGIRIRSLYQDSRGHLWISTSGRGVYEISPAGQTTQYNTGNGLLGNKMRMVTECMDGTIVAAGDAGLAFLKDGRVQQSVGYEQGLENPKVLCTLECADGTLLAGTDGGGIVALRDGKPVRTLGRQDGLGAEVILRMVRDSAGSGVFVVTSNSLCYLEADGSARVLSGFPYYNNFDLVEGNDGSLFVLSSAGIYVMDREELFCEPEPEYRLLDSKSGLQQGLTPNAWNYLDEDGMLYLSTDSGVLALNLAHYETSVRSYRMLVRSIQADGVSYPVEQGQTTLLPRGVNRIELTPEIINYSMNIPYVSVYLEGFDEEPKVVPQNELTKITYTNLPVGTYTFHLAVLDGKGKTVVAESAYRLEKEKEFYDNWWFILYAISVFALFVAYLTWLFFRTQMQRTLDMQRRELELAKSQVEMGNETVLTIARTVDAKDVSTSQHSFRVSEYAVLIARELGYGEEACEELRKTALLHDIGKIGIPDRVLNKPGDLTDEEYELMKSHVVKGAEILKRFTLVKNVQEGALYHHERYDGRGYVHGLKGEEIPLNARIIGLADAFDAMTANRVYRKQVDYSYVLEELKKGRGTQFDPKLVDVFLDLIAQGKIDIAALYGGGEEAEQ